jgi:CRISPR-associated protein Cmr3
MNHTYLIETLAPLVFRSGKPFGSQTGADGATFPPPSSLAGLLRTLHADQNRIAFSDELKDIAVAGPLLAWRTLVNVLTPLLPKPADAVYLLGNDGKARVLRLAPAPLPDGCGCDLPDALLPVGMAERLDGKPIPGPQYWPMAALESWCRGVCPEFSDLERDGLDVLPVEERTHVALDDRTLASDAGRLFQTAGIDLAPRWRSGHWSRRELVFLASSGTELDPTLATFGGERRLSRLLPADASAWPRSAPELEGDIRSVGGLRLTLATPAIFSGGYLPGWLDSNSFTGSPPGAPALSLRLRAAAVERWLPVSGWDLKERKARAMRKAVASGAVYWFELQGEAPDGFLDSLWLQPISDHPQDRLDGFGLALPAAWNPKS